ncbi:hypothetical protein PF003_g27516 [Phytophthora fragariae]|nr:hypothetical protein PF003_g27516 [Phytophthora fragariae]
MGEYEETRLKEAWVVRVEMCTSLNAKCIKTAIIELYVSTQKEIIAFLDINGQPYPSFIMVADFWTCKMTSEKFLGIRVYLIDKEW